MYSQAGRINAGRKASAPITSIKRTVEPRDYHGPCARCDVRASFAIISRAQDGRIVETSARCATHKDAT